jgi:hypothetical protein
MASDEDKVALRAMEEEFEKPTIDINGRAVAAVSVPVDHVVERFSEVHLADGTVIHIRQNVTGVLRAVAEWDGKGNPIYSLDMQAHMDLERVPKSLLHTGPGTA